MEVNLDGETIGRAALEPTVELSRGESAEYSEYTNDEVSDGMQVMP